MKVVVTIFERTAGEALRQAQRVDADMIEIRVDAFGGGSVERFRALKTPLLFTNRGGEPVDADFGLIDVEHGRTVRDPERTVLSHHDFEGVPDLEPLIGAMLAQGCAYTKIAVTPHDFRENETVLAAIREGLTIFGMGERGLYSRILAPFLGSELAFVSVDEEHAAAPGQISLENARAIYGFGVRTGFSRSRPAKAGPHTTAVFAVVGNPAGHSLSPTIHNPLFREHNVNAAYTIASVESFDEVIDPFTNGRLTGMSVTAPFKDDAFEFARRIGASIGSNALEAKAVNTLVKTTQGVLADNTDVDGFETLLREVRGKRGAVIGAGGTGRAAVVALRRAGFEVALYNRTPRDGALPLDSDIEADVVINTLPLGVTVHANATIEAAYRGPGSSGFQLLQAQAVRQNALFLKAFE